MSGLKSIDWRQPYDYESGGEEFIFVSYSHDDAEILRTDIEQMTDAGVRLWFDQAIKHGEGWKERVQKCIRHPKCIGACFYLSKNAVRSDPIADEVALVKEKRKQNAAFRVSSVNFDGKKAFQLLREADLSGESEDRQEERFRLFLDVFPNDALFFVRPGVVGAEEHLGAMIRAFDEWGARNPEIPYADPELFDWETYRDGLKITAYNGNATCLKIPSAIDGKRVIMLGTRAFADKKNLREVTVQEGIEMLDEGCFRGCENLEHVALPVSVATVGYEAFRGCRLLREITFQKNVVEVGDYCFYLCKKLRSVVFEASEKKVTLGFNCFQECDELTDVTLPSHAAKISMYCFNKCERLIELTMPRHIDAMADIVVHNCPSIRRIEFAGSLPKAYCGAIVKHCRRLEQIVFCDDELPAETARALAECDARRVVRLPAPAIRLDEATMTLVFAPVPNAVGYRAEIVYDTAEHRVVDVLEIEGEPCEVKERAVRISASMDEDKRISFAFDEEGDCACASFSVSLRACGDGARYADSAASEPVSYRNRDMDFIASKRDPETLERYVGVDADVTIPNRFRVVGKKAFAYSDTLEIIRLPDGLDEIGAQAFFHCKELRLIDWANSLPKSIGEEAFAYCFQLTELVFPRSIRVIGASAFEVCSGITAVDMSRCFVPEINFRAFRRCIALRDVKFSDNLDTIGDEAFRGCTALCPQSFPDGLMTIGKSAFSFLMDADEIHLPASVRKISSDFLWYSTGVSKITVDERCESFSVRDNTLLRVRKTEQGARFDVVAYPIDGPALVYTVPDGAEKIFRCAYRDLEHMREVTICDTVTEIEEENFSCCWDLKRVVLGKNVRKIGKNCFSHNISLEEIVLTGDTIPETDENSFAKNTKEVRILFRGETYISRADGDNRVWNKMRADVRQDAAE